MSLATLERAILASAKIVLKNPKLKMKDLLEWSTSDIKPKDDTEIVVRIPDPGVNICVPKAADKRG